MTALMGVECCFVSYLALRCMACRNDGNRGTIRYRWRTLPAPAKILLGTSGPSDERTDRVCIMHLCSSIF